MTTRKKPVEENAATTPETGVTPEKKTTTSRKRNKPVPKQPLPQSDEVNGIAKSNSIVTDDIISVKTDAPLTMLEYCELRLMDIVDTLFDNVIKGNTLMRQTPVYNVCTQYLNDLDILLMALVDEVGMNFWTFTGLPNYLPYTEYKLIYTCVTEIVTIEKYCPRKTIYFTKPEAIQKIQKMMGQFATSGRCIEQVYNIITASAPYLATECSIDYHGAHGYGPSQYGIPYTQVYNNYNPFNTLPAGYAQQPTYSHEALRPGPLPFPTHPHQLEVPCPDPRPLPAFDQPTNTDLFGCAADDKRDEKKMSILSSIDNLDNLRESLESMVTSKLNFVSLYAPNGYTNPLFIMLSRVFSISIDEFIDAYVTSAGSIFGDIGLHFIIDSESLVHCVITTRRAVCNNTSTNKDMRISISSDSVFLSGLLENVEPISWYLLYVQYLPLMEMIRVATVDTNPTDDCGLSKD